MRHLDVINPRNGQVDYQIDCLDAATVAGRALELRQAQIAWQDAGVDFRCEQFEQWRNAIVTNRAAIAEALCADTGRRLFAHFEVQKVLDLIDYWIGRAPQLLAKPKEASSRLVPSVRYHHELVPYQLVGVISPWNVPLILALIDAIPALLAGSAVLLKPSEVTPRFGLPLQASLEGIDGLADVIGIVTGDAETGVAIINEVDAICFTGSVSTGRKVGAQAAARFIPAFLELGGKDPAIVMPSADMDNAARAIIRSAVGMTGQACQSLERVYVHEAVHDQLLAILMQQLESVTINWPEMSRGQIGPLILASQGDTIQRQLDDAVARGATVHCGGQIEHHDGGRWCPPTLLTGVNHEMAVMREETFGPVIPLMPFATEDDALHLANDSEFGLSAAVFSGAENEALRIARALNVGAVSINDASLTALVNDVEKNSFCYSGLGGSRMGDTGLERFLRKRALLYQTAPAVSIDIFDESGMASL